MLIRYSRIGEIEEKVTESVENLNLLSELIQISEATKLYQTKKSVYSIICSVLEKYLQQNFITRQHFLELFYAYHKEDQEAVDKLLEQDECMVCEKFVIFTLLLLDGVSPSKDNKANIVFMYFKVLFGIAKVLNLDIESENKYDKYYLSLILNKFIWLNTYSSILIELITDNYLFGYSDLILFSLDYLQEVIKHNPTDNIIRNIIEILTNLEMPIEEILNSGSFFEHERGKIELGEFEKKLKKKCEGLWFEVLKYGKLTLKQKQHILRNLQDKVFPYVFHPLMFADFIIGMISTDINSTDDIETQIFSLSCILYLSQTCSYEYAPFYAKLYSLLNLNKEGKSAFDISKEVRLVYSKLLELSLKSSTVPHALVCAFIKKLARLAIKSSLSSTISSLGIILNLIKRHPKTIELIHKFSKDKVSSGDPFNETAKDPMDSLGHQSSLWELGYLRKHYNPVVRELVDLFSTKFTTEESMNMEELGKINYLLTAKREQKRTISKLDANVEKLYKLPNKRLKVEDPLLDIMQF